VRVTCHGSPEAESHYRLFGTSAAPAACGIGSALVRNPRRGQGSLELAGFGETKPIDSNATDGDRRNNRCVEFHIVGRKTNAEAP
jgi:flagellar motor protein MotB